MARVGIGKVNAAILSGEEDISLWSEEELIRGQRRDKNGHWTGRPPKVVPKALHDELVARKMTAADDLLRESTYDAVAVLREVALDKEADPAIRIRASEMILDRTKGKPTANMQLQVATHTLFDQTFEDMIFYDEEHVIEATASED